jgi:hypothetical protein
MTLMARKRDFGVDGALHKKSKMPRPCAVETRVGRYTDGLSNKRLDATGSSRGDSRSALNSGKRETPRDKPVASGDFVLIVLAANMKFHGTSLWYLF